MIEDTELKQVAYIFKCVNSTLQIKGKINSITVDNCKKLGLVFDDVVGIVEIINSKDVKVQVTRYLGSFLWSRGLIERDTADPQMLPW